MTTNLLFASLSYPHSFESWKSIYIVVFIHKSNKHFVVETENNYNRRQPVNGKKMQSFTTCKIIQTTNCCLLHLARTLGSLWRGWLLLFPYYINYYKYDCHMPILIRKKLRDLIDNNNAKFPICADFEHFEHWTLATFHFHDNNNNNLQAFQTNVNRKKRWYDWIVKYSSDALFEWTPFNQPISSVFSRTMNCPNTFQHRSIDQSNVIFIQCSIPFIAVTSCSDNSIWLANMVKHQTLLCVERWTLNIFTILQSPYY